MNTSSNTILITGGSAGIGFEIARIFSNNGNRVIITGRNKEKLQLAASKLSNVTPIVSDVSSEEQVNELVHTIRSQYPSTNIVINNAGSAFLHDLATDTGVFSKAQQEILTNYLAIAGLNEKLLPLLVDQHESAIVNVSSIVAFVPGSLPTYSASKAALHSYTQSLRIALENTSVKVFELMPPLVDTDFSAPIGGHNGIPPADVAKRLFESMAIDEYEIRVGQTQAIYELFLSSPQKAIDAMRKRTSATAAAN